MTYQERKNLPYGMFTTADGRQVIFGRGYRLLFERAGPNHKNGGWTWEAVSEQRRLDLQESLTIWFYDDATPTELKEEIAADWQRRISGGMRRDRAREQVAASPEAKALRYENATE